MMNKARSYYLACALCLLAASGCGIFDDVATFTFDTDWKRFDVDASQMGFSGSGAIPEVPCSTAVDPCSASSELACGGGSIDCEVLCGGGGTCEATATVVVKTPVDISQQVKNQTSADALSKVSLDRVEYEIESNSLNFKTPQLTFYVGPQQAEAVTDAGVKLFATLDPIEPGTTGTGELVADEAGKAAVATFVKNYKVPFSMLAEATILFEAGQEIPTGQMKLKVKAVFKAELL